MLGKRVMQRNAAEEAPLRALLVDANIGLDLYTVVRYNFKVDDLISDKIDVMSAYITDQPYDIRQRGVEINIIQPQNYGIDFYGDLLITSNQELEQHPGRAERFLRASLKGWKYAFENTEQLIQLIKQQYNSHASIERLRNEALEIRKLVLPNTILLGQIQVSRLRHVNNIYSRLKLSRKLNDRELSAFIYTGKAQIKLNAQEQQWLKQHPVIRLGIDKNFAPYERLTEQGEYAGIAADYIKILEQRLNVRFEIVKDKNSWHEVLKAAKNGEIDMLSCLVKTPERTQFLNFSQPYLNSSAVIISEQSNGYIGSLDQLLGKRVAIQKGHYTQELLARNYSGIDIVSTKGGSNK
jgi:ABC-type nitrate/sulfonate/bicarbonate transport system substrate-binding protein